MQPAVVTQGFIDVQRCLKNNLLIHKQTAVFLFYLILLLSHPML